MNLKQTLLVISAGLVLTLSAQANLSPNNFAVLKTWAEEQGYRYDGVENFKDDFGKPIYYWRFTRPKTANIAIVLRDTVSTVREAQIAFQSSEATDVLVRQMLDKDFRNKSEFSNSDVSPSLEFVSVWSPPGGEHEPENEASKSQSNDADILTLPSL